MMVTEAVGPIKNALMEAKKASNKRTGYAPSCVYC